MSEQKHVKLFEEFINEKRKITTFDYDGSIVGYPNSHKVSLSHLNSKVGFIGIFNTGDNNMEVIDKNGNVILVNNPNPDVYDDIQAGNDLDSIVDNYKGETNLFKTAKRVIGKNKIELIEKNNSEFQELFKTIKDNYG